MMTTNAVASPHGDAVSAALPHGCRSPFDLLRAAKRAGRHFGLGPQDLVLLEYYLCFARTEDWHAAGRPICSRAVCRTAADLGVTPRSINTSERRLERLGLIRRATRADGARGGRAVEGGGPLYGIELAPLVAAYPALLACIEAVSARRAEVEHLRAAISRLLGEGRRLLSGLEGRRLRVRRLFGPWHRDAPPPRAMRRGFRPCAICSPGWSRGYARC